MPSSSSQGGQSSSTNTSSSATANGLDPSLIKIGDVISTRITGPSFDFASEGIEPVSTSAYSRSGNRIDNQGDTTFVIRRDGSVDFFVSTHDGSTHTAMCGGGAFLFDEPNFEFEKFNLTSDACEEEEHLQ